VATAVRGVLPIQYFARSATIGVNSKSGRDQRIIFFDQVLGICPGFTGSLGSTQALNDCASGVHFERPERLPADCRIVERKPVRPAVIRFAYKAWNIHVAMVAAQRPLRRHDARIPGAIPDRQ